VHRPGAFVRVAGTLEKVARIYGNIPLTPGEYSWSDRYKGTPFYREALEIERQEALEEAQEAREHVEQESSHAAESALRVEIAQLEAALVEWRYQNMGLSKGQATSLAKTAALCGHVAKCVEGGGPVEWSDAFKGSPYYQQAIELEKRDAEMEAARAAKQAARPVSNRWAVRRARRTALEAKYLAWKQQQQGGAPTQPQREAEPAVQVSVPRE